MTSIERARREVQTLIEAACASADTDWARSREGAATRSRRARSPAAGRAYDFACFARERTALTMIAARRFLAIVYIRMKRAGARFSQHGGQTVMLFRAAILSDRFDALSEILEHTYTASLKAA